MKKLLFVLLIYQTIFSTDFFYTIVIPTFNNIRFWEKNLLSAVKQDYNNSRIIIIDDNSTDGTGEEIQTWISKNNPLCEIKFYKNKKRSFALANLYRAIHTCKNSEIIITLDGDDWLAHDKIFQRLNKEYDQGCWLTYGQFKQFPSGKVGGNAPLIKNNPIRNQKLVLSHLRTFYAGLFKQIKLVDLVYKDKFFPCVYDFAIMFPMAEMAGNRTSFISDILYVYNKTNPLHCGAQMGHKMLGFLNGYIRTKAPYKVYQEDCKKDYGVIRFKIFKQDTKINQIKNSIKKSNSDFIVLTNQNKSFEEAVKILRQTKLDVLIIGEENIKGEIISPFHISKEYFAIRYKKLNPQKIQSLIIQTNYFYRISKNHNPNSQLSTINNTN